MVKTLRWSMLADVQSDDIPSVVNSSLGLIYYLHALCCLANIYQMVISRQKVYCYLFNGNMCTGTSGYPFLCLTIGNSKIKRTIYLLSNSSDLAFKQ